MIEVLFKPSETIFLIFKLIIYRETLNTEFETLQFVEIYNPVKYTTPWQKKNYASLDWMAVSLELLLDLVSNSLIQYLKLWNFFKKSEILIFFFKNRCFLKLWLKLKKILELSKNCRIFSLSNKKCMVFWNWG